nr:pollen-specific leucine-rich repeat extensin-like protein 3 [Procambarus clarkii]
MLHHFATLPHYMGEKREPEVQLRTAYLTLFSVGKLLCPCEELTCPLGSPVRVGSLGSARPCGLQQQRPSVWATTAAPVRVGYNSSARPCGLQQQRPSVWASTAAPVRVGFNNMLPKVAVFQAVLVACAVGYPDNSFARGKSQSTIHRRGIRLTPSHIPPDADLFRNDLGPTQSNFNSIYYNLDPIPAAHGPSTPIPARGFKPMATSSVYMGPEPLSFDSIDLDFDPFYSRPVHLASGHIRPDSRLPTRPTHGPIRPTLGPIHGHNRPIHLTKGPVHPTQGPIPQSKEPLHPTPEPILPLPKPIRPPPGPVHPTSGPFHPSLGPIPSTSYPSHPSPESTLLKPRPIHRKPRIKTESDEHINPETQAGIGSTTSSSGRSSSSTTSSSGRSSSSTTSSSSLTTTRGYMGGDGVIVPFSIKLECLQGG